MKPAVSVKYFSILAEIANKRDESVRLENGQSLKELLDFLIQKYPEMEKYSPYLRVAVNQNYVTLDYKPSKNDEIVFITPVSGG